MFSCRLSWAGLLPIARMVEATEEDAGAVEELDRMRSRRFPFDQSLLSALVDRWRPETRTFHFRWGEMTVTLQDMACLLGLPLSGHAIGLARQPGGAFLPHTAPRCGPRGRETVRAGPSWS